MALKTRLDLIESNGQPLSEVLTSSQKGMHMTIFLAACEQGRLEIVEFLLEKGSKIDERCESNLFGNLLWNVGDAGLHLAARNGHLNLLSRLIH